MAMKSRPLDGNLDRETSDLAVGSKQPLPPSSFQNPNLTTPDDVVPSRFDILSYVVDDFDTCSCPNSTAHNPNPSQRHVLFPFHSPSVIFSPCFVSPHDH
ncbi:hypothetical protein NE237_020008 [Protea cynaroides]|uniref:Uncharacterized protein n=1 Tax=Protea cynaroides TaxID=273540 RepID=A0A9Q0H893_9MAGN|nr:hypothetical protein NE237_020008 [Protea cynaroides]